MSVNIMDGVDESAIVKKLTWRLAPLLTLGFVIAQIDRANVGIGALQMNRAIGLNSAEFGIGAGLFFVSYVIFEIPSTLIQARIGGPRWLARIMISWGIASALMSVATGPYSFYGIRLLIGAMEAGYLPGVMLYLSAFFPPRYRASILALFAVAIPLSSVIGSPISSALLGFDGILGVRGWQWMFLTEGIPAVIIGVMLLFLLPRDLFAAPWLTTAEKSWLAEQLAAEVASTRVTSAGIWRVITNPYALMLSLAFTGSVGVGQALALWQPQMIREFGLTNLQVGAVNAVPFALAAVTMLVWGYRSDRVHERLVHTIVPLGLSAAALACAPFVHEFWSLILMLCLAQVGAQAMKGPFLGLTSEWLAGPAAVVGFAQVNSLGNAAAFLASTSIGVIRESTGSFQLALLPLMCTALTGAAGLIVMARRDTLHRRLVQRRA
jgi:MFS family permease